MANYDRLSWRLSALGTYLNEIGEGEAEDLISEAIDAFQDLEKMTKFHTTDEVLSELIAINR